MFGFSPKHLPEIVVQEMCYANATGGRNRSGHTVDENAMRLSFIYLFTPVRESFIKPLLDRLLFVLLCTRSDAVAAAAAVVGRCSTLWSLVP